MMNAWMNKINYHPNKLWYNYFYWNQNKIRVLNVVLPQGFKYLTSFEVNARSNNFLKKNVVKIKATLFESLKRNQLFKQDLKKLKQIRWHLHVASQWHLQLASSMRLFYFYISIILKQITKWYNSFIFIIFYLILPYVSTLLGLL